MLFHRYFLKECKDKFTKLIVYTIRNCKCFAFVGLVNIWFYWEGFVLIICYLLRLYWSLILMMMVLSRYSVLPGSALSDPLCSAWSMVRCPAFGSPSTFGWSIGASLSGLSWPMMMVSERHVWAADLVMMVSERHVWAADLVMGCGVPEAW